MHRSVGAAPSSRRLDHDASTTTAAEGERHLLRVSEQAEKEPAAFAAAATELFGPEEARQSIEDWMEELALVNWAHGEPTADWRPVTISASARLADRLPSSAEFPLTCLSISVRHTTKHGTMRDS